MSSYVKKPEVVAAEVWWKNGDHSEDGNEVFPEGSQFAGEKLEGKVVRRFRHPGVDGQKTCRNCGQLFHVHGWLDFSLSGQAVCPGDYIIAPKTGHRFAMHPKEFTSSYDEV